MAAGSVAAILDLIPLSQALHCTDDAGGRALRVRRPTPAALDSIAGKVPARCASRALRAAAPTGELLSEVRLSAVQVEQILDQALRAAVSCRRGRDRDAGASPPPRPVPANQPLSAAAPLAARCSQLWRGGGGAITEFCGLLTDLRWSGAVLAVTVGPDRRVCVLVQSRR